MSQVKELYAQIREALKTCDPNTTPVICGNLESEESMGCIVQTIAEYSLVKKLNISQAINAVEKSYSLNNID